MFGGGIFTYGTMTVTNSTIADNSALEFGGGLKSAGTTTLTNCTIVYNSVASGGEGTGLNVSFGTATLDNTIVALNTVGAGNNAAPSDINVFLGATLSPSSGYNVIGTGGSGGLADGVNGNQVGVADPGLDPNGLQNNGGPTQTIALLANSPAIDAGSNALAVDAQGNPLTTDQRGPGFPRIVNGVNDIGAFEVQAVAPSVTCTVADFLLWPANHKLVNVGLGVGVDPTGATLYLQVYANDGATAADAADIGPDTLRLRAERQGGEQGRVYLIVVTAINASGQTGFDVCTVVVPHDQSAASLAAVKAAAAAEAYYREFQAAPTGYGLLGKGPAGGHCKGHAGGTFSDAADRRGRFHQCT